MAACIADFVQGKTEELELEMLDLKNDILLKSLISGDFWNTVDKEKFPFLKRKWHIKCNHFSVRHIYANHCFQI